MPCHTRPYNDLHSIETARRNGCFKDLNTEETQFNVRRPIIPKAARYKSNGSCMRPVESWIKSVIVFCFIYIGRPPRDG